VSESSPDDDGSLRGDLARLVERRPGRRPWRRPLFWVLIVAGLLLVVLALPAVLPPADAQPRWRTQEASRGDIVVRVNTTGTLQPVNQVDVGSELSGTVVRVPVDDNSPVVRGQLLAQLDTVRLVDTVRRSEAAVQQAQAQLAQARNTVQELAAKLERQRTLARETFGALPAAIDIEAGAAGLLRAQQTVDSAVAGLESARATLNSDRNNLSKASIRAPVSGVVLSRKVDPGQTVAASLQAPVLFVVAEDLSKMELEADVDEADVGRLRVGQSATFTVDAHIGEQFTALVTRVGLGSKVKDGVVTYRTLLQVANPAGRLRPGMTATARIVTAERRGVLVVPAAALRFSPESIRTGTASSGRGILSALIPRGPDAGGVRTRASDDEGGPILAGHKRLWVLRAGRAVAVDVVVGLGDGNQTEVTGGGLAVGDAVIVGQAS
jgi:HlyD family secretion protein